MRSLSLRLRVAIYSQSLTWPLEGVSRHFCAGKPKSQILAPERELSLPWLREESILSWLGINTLNNISSTFYLMVTLSPRSYLQSLTSFFCFLTHLTPWPTLSLHQHIYCPSLTHLNPLTLLSPNQPKYKKIIVNNVTPWFNWSSYFLDGAEEGKWFLTKKKGSNNFKRIGRWLFLKNNNQTMLVIIVKWKWLAAEIS